MACQAIETKNQELKAKNNPHSAHRFIHLQTNYFMQRLMYDTKTSYFYLFILLFCSTELLSQQIIGTTRYDLQSNATMCRRVLNEGNGTVHAMWTMALQDDFGDRGTGYNQSITGGLVWGVPPVARLENTRTGWPNIGKTSSGRLFSISHSGSGLHFAYQDEGSIGWTDVTVGVDLGDTNGVWARAANSGDTIHVIIGRSGGSFGSGIDGGILYFRSQDAGDTWEGPTDIQPGMADIFAIGGGDTYSIDAQGDQVAFVMGDFGDQVVLYKSNDAGDTWQRTLVVPTTDPFLQGILDPVATSNGHYSIIIDHTGKVHIWYNRFFVYREQGTDPGSLFILDDSAGLMYWNEDMMQPILIGKTVRQDEDGDGETTIDNGVIALRGYRFGAVSQPSAGIDAAGHLYVAYSSMRDGAFQANSDGTRMFRDVYLIKSTDGGATWQGPLNVSDSPITEDVFPHIARLVDTHVHLIYQNDEFAGINLQPNDGHEQITTNRIIYHNIPVIDIVDPVEPDNTLPLIFRAATTFTNTTLENCLPDYATFFSGHVIDYPDGDITDQVMITGLDVSQPGEDVGFWVFEVTDQAGNTRIDSLILGSTDSGGGFVPDPVDVLADTIEPFIFGEPFDEFFTDEFGNILFNTFFDLFDTVDVLINTSYTDLGAFAIDFPGPNTEGPEYGNVYGCQPTLTVDNPVDVNQLGTYIVTYNAVDINDNEAEPVQRVVRVIEEDTIPPIIILNADENGDIDTVYVEVGSVAQWTEPGFSAFDNVDGNLTTVVIVSIQDEDGNMVTEVDVERIGTFVVTYQVTDAANNTTTITRTVIVDDTQPPVISLTPPPTVPVSCGTSYNEPGFIALDNVDGIISHQVEVGFLALGFDPPVSLDGIPNCAGNYAVTYNVSDASGNQAAQVSRTVVVTGECTDNCPFLFQTQIKVFLEGPYNTDMNLMNPHHTSPFNTLPSAQPFNTAPWNYTGSELINNMNTIPNAVDWLLVELRDRNNPEIVVAQKAALVLSDGTVVNTDGLNLLSFTNNLIPAINTTDFFLVIHPRNHLAVMSATPIINGNSYDFTSSLSQAMGTNQMAALPNGEFALYAGDINKSGVINVADFNNLVNQIGQTGYPRADLDFNGVVDVDDFNLYQRNASKIGIAAIRYD